MDPTSKDEGGMCALHWAAVEILQNHPNSGCSKDRIGRTAMHCAVENNRISVVEKFVKEFHINVNLSDDFGRTPLHWAAEKGYQEIMQLLLNNGADVDAQDFANQTALSRAAWRGWQECVSLLLDQEARSDVPDQNGQLPLVLAAANGRSQVVSHLCEKHSLTAIDSDRKTSLHLAAKSGHGDAARVIIENLVLVNANRNHIFCTLEQADGWQNDFADIDRDADVLVWAALNGIETAGAGQIAAVELLLNNKADVNARPATGSCTALQAASGAGHIKMVELLLNNKAHIDAPPDTGGCTALQAAASAGHTEIVELLLKNKADINAAPAFSNGLTALQAAAGAGHIDIVELLLSNKADVNAPPAKEYGRPHSSLSRRRRLSY
ncbi:unnamed protein product [Penicillium glandicola]